jgi:hypothetical protein
MQVAVRVKESDGIYYQVLSTLTTSMIAHETLYASVPIAAISVANSRELLMVAT